MNSFIEKLANLLTCVYYVLLGVLIFLSMRGHEGAKYYFGFLDGKIAKAFFFLFCALLVYPINVRDNDCTDGSTSCGTDGKNDDFRWFFVCLSAGLAVVAIA
jgi:hypothetical protein